MHDQGLGKQFSFKEMLLLVVAFSLFGFAGLIHQKYKRPAIEVQKQDSAINLSNNLLLFLNLGNKRLISDLLWTRTLLESDEAHYAKNDLNSWMYLRFLSISVLDPMFYENYMYGGLYLSIVKDDVNGAADIFEKGLLVYPDDYKLNYYAGFNYYFEMGEFQKGKDRFEKIKDAKEAPPFLKLLLNKLNFETSKDYDSTLLFLEHEYNQSKDSAIKKKIGSDIYSLKAERDLNCLNSKQDNCERRDADGIPYKYENGAWKAAKEFNPYRIHTPNRKE